MSKVRIKCLQCGKPIWRSEAAIRIAKHSFCCYSCKAAYYCSHPKESSAKGKSAELKTLEALAEREKGIMSDEVEAN